MLWHEQSWPAIQKLDKQTPVVVPLGSCEQHGHHLPLFVDTMQVTGIAEGVHAKLADKILLTPTLWLGASDHHKDFPGTISVSPSLYSQMIESVTLSILRAGFRRILFLNGHGGNEIPAAQALTELVGKLDDADAACLAFNSWWKLGQAALVPPAHGLVSPVITHACEWETSLMLFLRPDLVKQNLIDPKLAPLPAAWHTGRWSGGKISVYHRFHRLTAAGHLGNPQIATPEKGKSMFNALVNEIADFLENFATWPHLAALGPK